jgi:hypothetical protein
MAPSLFDRLSQLPTADRWALAQNTLLLSHAEPLLVIGEPSAEVLAGIVASVGLLPQEAGKVVLVPSTLVGQTIAYLPDWKELGVFLTRPPETETEKLLVRMMAAYSIWKKIAY